MFTFDKNKLSRLCLTRQLQKSAINLLLIVLLSGFTANAQAYRRWRTEIVNKYLSTKSSLASLQELTLKESPAIITIIGEEEIRNSGARDLIDLLRLVPGFSACVDKRSTTAMSLHGIWGFEGKILFMLDGRVLNEDLYASFPLGSHISVNQIQQIEIIRGAASALYGGYAGLGIVNIVSKKGESFKKIEAGVLYGLMEKADARKSTFVNAGNKLKDFEFGINGFLSQGIRTDQPYISRNDTLDLSDGEAAVLSSENASLNMAYKGMRANFIYDNYKTKAVDFLGEIQEEGIQSDFRTISASLDYQFSPVKQLTLIPKVNYTFSRPWFSTDSIAYTNITTNRMQAELIGIYDLTKNINILAGGVYGKMRTEKNDIAKEEPFTFGDYKVKHATYATYLHLRLNTNFANLTLGARLDSHEKYGKNISPRIGFSKTAGDVFMKLLYSKAFRAPGIAHINFSQDNEIKPEKIRNLEVEFGYKVGKTLILSANLFDILIKNAIVYDPALRIYSNAEDYGTNGIGAEFRLLKRWGYVNLSYSFYAVKDTNKIACFHMPENASTMPGIPHHKISLNSHFRLFEKLSINPSAVYQSKKFGYKQVLPGEELQIVEFEPVLLANCYISFKDILKGFDIGIGVYDILNAKYAYVQPYRGTHSPYSGSSREYFVKLTYNFELF